MQLEMSAGKKSSAGSNSSRRWRHCRYRTGKICRIHAGKKTISIREKPVKKEAEAETKVSSGIFSQEIINQLNVVFSRMEGKTAAGAASGFPSRKSGVKNLYDGTGKIYRQTDRI